MNYKIIDIEGVGEAYAAKLQEVNDRRHLVRRVPSEKEVAAMIEQAAALPPVMTY